ncbi:MAG: hypothetical protein E7122_00655 [Bacteroidales bacterium]|nr:hypothetical protein [Bacteroidales bacterium]
MNTTFRGTVVAKGLIARMLSTGSMLSSTQRISGVDEVRCAAAFVLKMVLLRGWSAVRCSVCPQNGHSAWMECGALQHLSTKWVSGVDEERYAMGFVHK